MSPLFRFALVLLFSLSSATTSGAAVFLTWDWDEPTVATDGTETINVYATLSHAPRSSNDLAFNLQSHSTSPGSLVDSGGTSSANPYVLDTSGLFAELGGFSADHLEIGESITFLWGVLTPKDGQAPAGSHSLSRATLGFSAALYFDAESTLTVEVTPPPPPVPISALPPGVVGLLSCGLMVLLLAWSARRSTGSDWR